jgi:Tfp pilus assembly protein PilF
MSVSNTLPLAVHYLNINKPERALDVLEEAIVEDRESERYWHFRTRALLRLGRYDEAEAICNMGLSHHPEDPELRHLLSHAKRMQGDLAAAERSMRACLESVPAHPGYLACYAELLLRGGKLDAASAVLDLASREMPNSLVVKKHQLFLNYLQNNGHISSQELAEFSAEYPEEAVGYVVMGLSACHAGDMTTASDYLHRAGRLEPNDQGVILSTRMVRLKSHPLLKPLLPIWKMGLAWTLIIQLSLLWVAMFFDLPGAVTLLAVIFVGYWVYGFGAITRVWNQIARSTP